MSTAATPRTATDLALIAAFAALIAVCALLPAHHGRQAAVPITLQTFAVLLAGCRARPACAASSPSCSTSSLGAAGLPVFAGALPGSASSPARRPATWSASRSPPASCGFLVERLPRRAPTSAAR